MSKNSASDAPVSTFLGHEGRWAKHRNAMRIFATALILILIVAAAIAWELRRERVHIIEGATNEAVRLAKSLSINAKNAIDAAEVMLEQIEHDVADRGYPAAESRFLGQKDRIAQLLPAVDNLFLINADGLITASTVEGVEDEVSVAESPDFLGVKAAGGSDLWISKPRAGEVTGDVVLLLIKRLVDREDRFAGLVSASIGPGHFDRVFSGLELEDQTAILLAHVDGTVMTRFPRTKSIGTSFADRPLFSKHLVEAPSGNFISPKQSDGEVRIVAYERVANAPLVVAAAIHLGQSLLSWRERAQNRGLFLLFFALFGLGNAAYLSKRSAERERLLAESKRQANDLAASEARFRDLTNLSMDWYWETDTEQRLTQLSDSDSLKRIGLSRDHLLGRKRSSIAETPEAKRMVKKIQEAMDLEESFYDVRRPISSADGKTIWISLSGSPMYDGSGRVIGYRGSGRDVTKQVEIDREVREQRELLQMMMENVPGSMYLKDPSSRFLLINDRHCKQLGLTRNEIIGNRLTDLIDEKWARTFEAQDQEVIETTKVTEFEVMIEKSGEERHFHVTKFPVFDLNGNFVALAGINIDVTEQKNLESRLQEAERVKTIGQITGGIAHDFNNILAVVIGDLEMALAEPNREKRTNLVKEALAAAETSAELTHKLLSFSRRAALHVRSLDPGETILGMKDILRTTIPERIDLDLEIDSDLNSIAVDKSQLMSAILNLVINSRDAIKGSGQIKLGVRKDRLSSRSMSDLDKGFVKGAEPQNAPGDYIAITVADTGEGVPDDVLGKIFDPFFTTKPVGEGSGMGLPMVHGFCVQSGGAISIETSEGKGTAITLYFPVSHEAPNKQQDGQGLEQSSLELSSKAVLLVEDEPRVREMTSRNLQKLGLTVQMASNGSDALEILSGESHLDLLITDGVLPGEIQGPTIAVHAKECRPGITTILVSGYPPEELDRIGGLHAFDEILMKPFRKKALEKTILRALSDVGARVAAESADSAGLQPLGRTENG